MNIPTKYFHAGDAATIKTAKEAFTHPNFRLSVFKKNHNLDEVMNSVFGHSKNITVHCVFDSSCDQQMISEIQTLLNKNKSRYLKFHYVSTQSSSLTEIKERVLAKGIEDATYQNKRNAITEGSKKQQKNHPNPNGLFKKFAY